MSKNISINRIAVIALMAAVLCILSPVSIPIFISPVPVSLGVLAVYLTAYVFSGYSGGLGKLLGPTGGYIIGFIFTVYISSLLIHLKKGILYDVIGMVLGLALCYLPGTLWFSYQQGKGFIASLALCVVPFLIGDIIKIFVAYILGSQISKRLNHLNL